MSPSFPTRAFFLIVVAGAAGCAAHRGVAVPRTVTATLERKAPGVTWDAEGAVKGDFDYDGEWDLAIGGKKGETFVVGIVAGPRGERAWTLEFPVGEGTQDGLCSAKARLVAEKVTEEAFVGAEKLRAGSRGIALHDDLCDAFHIYWDPQKERFAWWRL